MNWFSNAVNNTVGAVGDGISQASKHTWNAVETTVQVTGVGKVAESCGVHVDSNIYDNGIQANVAGQKMGVKAASAGGNFGINAKYGEVEVLSGELALKINGFKCGVSVGATVNIDMREIRKIDNLFEMILEGVEKVKTAVPQARGIDYAIEHTTGKKCTEIALHLFKNFEFIYGDFNNLIEKFLNTFDCNIFVSMTCGATVSLSGSYLFGALQQITYNNQTREFLVTGGSFKFTVAGLKIEAGAQAPGKDAFGLKDTSIMLNGTVQIESFTIGMKFIIAFNLPSQFKHLGAMEAFQQMVKQL